MNRNRPLLLKNRQVTLSEFGYITALDEHDETFEISSDDGKKTYKCKRCITNGHIHSKNVESLSLMEYE